MKSARELDYRLHHLCIYDDKPRENMWPYLRWHHGITNYFSGAVFHVTGEGHSDYTFLGCGGRAYQVQIEAPPFQFEYERNWWADHGRGYNHICWITSDARASMEQLLANGATEVMPFEEFPTYDGFVVHDPEGRWVEIMEYVGGFKTPDVEFRPVGHVELQTLGVVQLCLDLDSQVDWYVDVMGQRILHDARSDNDGLVYLADHTYDRRQCVTVLATPANDAERELMERHGPAISSILYQAGDVDLAWRDGAAAGFEEVAPPAHDDRIGCTTGYLREPSGNIVQIRERLLA